MSHNRPCTTRPDLFLQPGEDHNWHTTAAATTARNLCTTVCQFRTDCAREALTLGTLEGTNTPRVADGVIAAGIVCRGDADTLYRLQRVAGLLPLHRTTNTPAPTPAQPAATGTACTGCNTPAVPKDQPRIDGTVHLAARGLCWACYTAAKRAGTLTATKAPRPEHCTDCARPMTASRKRPPEGWVMHESRGRCTACTRRHTAQETAA